jgi:hypothetical protein
MILAVPVAPEAVCARATDSSQGEVGIALRESVARALARTDFEDRGAEIYSRLSAALHRASAQDGTFTSPEAVGRALDLLNLLPPTVPLPEVVVESDTEIGLDWDEGSRRVVSLTVRENPMIGFAALFGAEPVYGRTPFVGEVPRIVRFLLDRLYARRSNR